MGKMKKNDVYAKITFSLPNPKPPPPAFSFFFL